jgi:two-component system chemotaxis sensor kinase CheA
MTNMEKNREAFREEASGLFAELEAALLKLEESPDDLEHVEAAFRALHTIKGSSYLVGLDEIAGFTHEIETVFDMVRSGEVAVSKRLIDLVLSARDHIKKMTEGDAADWETAAGIISSLHQLASETIDKEDCQSSITVEIDARSLEVTIKNIFDSQGYITRDDYHEVIEMFRLGVDVNATVKKRLAMGLTGDDGLYGRVKEKAAVAELQKVLHKRDSESSLSSIRVPSEKLDRLAGLVSELVTVQARLKQISTVIDNSELDIVSEDVERLTDDLRKNTRDVRMMPVGAIFSKFRRMVRDLSRDVDKEVEITIDGAETELDKTVIERLNDSLVHLVKNCIDHGIEMPNVRKSLGKPEKGEIRLSATHLGANVLIQISDDGAGFDIEAISARAIAKGLAAPHDNLSEKEIIPFALAPGISTAEKITNISGRGVGLDVVNKSIETLQGSIEIESKKGSGTIFSLKLPLKLAALDGLLVRIGEGFFILPLSIVEECIELTLDDVEVAHGSQIANVRDEIISYINLREYLAINGGNPQTEMVVVTQIHGQKVGFVVDSIIGEHQTFIKSPGNAYRDVEGISGASMLCDGTVALILDVARLTQRTEKEEH